MYACHMYACNARYVCALCTVKMRVMHGENACIAQEHEKKLTNTYTHAHTHTQNSAAKGDTCWGAAATVRRLLAVRRALERGAICTNTQPQYKHTHFSRLQQHAAAAAPASSFPQFLQWILGHFRYIGGSFAIADSY
jgi:hypothetical protein